MWIFTKYGFFSTVCAREGDGRRSDPVDESTIAVRARSLDQLQSLLNRFERELGRPEIKSYVGTDYQYRVFVPKENWRLVCGELAAELDYDNFKSEVSRSEESSQYVELLHAVWGAVDDAYWAEGR
jgi:hypothetical protein